MKRGTQTRASTRKTRKDGESPFRGAVDDIELELLVKRAGRDAPIEVRIPTSAALLSPEGGGTSEPEPVFVTRRDAPIDRGALGNALAEAYFQPSFDCDTDSVDTQMREYRRRITYIVTELLRVPRGRSRRGPPRTRDDLHPAVDGRRLEHRHRDPQRRPHGYPPDLTTPTPGGTIIPSADARE